MKLFGQDRELGLCPKVNRHVIDPRLLQMGVLKALPGMSFSSSAMMHVSKITKPWQKCLYFCTGQNKGIFLMDILF